MTEPAPQAAATSRRTLLLGGTAGAVALGGSIGAGYAVSRDDGTSLGGPRRPERRDPVQGRRESAPRPNVIVISVDDLGWNDLGCYGNTFNETPHLDRLAREGMRFTQAYAAAPVCSPSRAALMTGRYPARCGVTDYLRNEDSPSDLRLSTGIASAPRILKKLGYRSGLIGKWHLTETYSGDYAHRPGGPVAHGFDDVIASEQLYIAGGDYFHPYKFMPTLPAREPGEHLTDRLAAEAVDYIGRHKRRPFFLHVSNYAVHEALRGKSELVARYAAKPGADERQPELAAMLTSVDEQVGRIVRALHDEGIADRTLLLVTSDNGTPYPDANLPLRAGKGALYEGGIRVPLLAYWPGQVPAGTTSDALTSTIDLLPTAWELAGGSEAERPDFDGISLAGTLTGGPAADRDLYWAYPHYLGNYKPCAAVRSGPYKVVRYLRKGHVELYDVLHDAGERHNLASAEPLLLRALNSKLDQHLADVSLLPPAPSVAAYPRRRSGSRGGRALGGAFALTLPVASVGGTRRPSVTAIGLASDPANYLHFRYLADTRTVDWQIVVDGVSQLINTESLRKLAGTVDLSSPTARFGVSARGTEVAVYADDGHGWEFLFRADVGGVIDLTDPAVRRSWHPTVLADGASLGADRLELRTA
jgi:arylsulfatase A-like enzyme